MISPTVLDEAITTYNECRSPMATVEQIGYTDYASAIRFETPFCPTSCVYDYFEDLIYELDKLDEDPSLIDISMID